MRRYSPQKAGLEVTERLWVKAKSKATKIAQDK